MSDLLSGELSECQNVLNIMVQDELKEPMIDFKLIKKLLSILEVVDDRRRKTWNKEKFGKCELIADQVFDKDDIPF